MPFDFKKYDEKCRGLTAEELQREWQHYTRLITGAATSTTVSGLAIPLTAGVSTIGVALAAPAIHNARKKREIIERHLNRHNTTHETRKRDVLGGVAVSGTIGVVTLGVGTLGADAIAAHGAEHGISAIVENETAIKVVSHVALDGVGMGIEHAHTNHLRKRDARKAFEAAGVFKAVEDAKAAEAGYTISPYNPQGVAAGSSASLPYYAPPPPYSYDSGPAQFSIPEQYNVSPMAADPYYGLDSKAPMPPFHQPQNGQAQSDDFAPPSMPPPEFVKTYDMTSMGVALPNVCATMPSSSPGYHSQQDINTSRSVSTEQSVVVPTPAAQVVLPQYSNLSELSVEAGTQPPVPVPSAVAHYNNIIPHTPSYGTSGVSSLPPIVAPLGSGKAQSEDTEADFMYPPPVAPPPGHATQGQSMVLPSTPIPPANDYNAISTAPLPVATTHIVSPDVQAQTGMSTVQKEPQTPYHPCQGTLTGYSSHISQYSLTQPLSAQALSTTSSSGQLTRNCDRPDYASTATNPVILQTSQSSSQIAHVAVSSPLNQIHGLPTFQQSSPPQPGSLQRHLTAPNAPKPLNASRRASVAPIQSYSYQGGSPSQHLEDHRPQSTAQQAPRYMQETFNNCLPSSGVALPPTPQSLPMSPLATEGNKASPSYFPEGVFIATDPTAGVGRPSSPTRTIAGATSIEASPPQHYTAQSVPGIPATLIASKPSVA